MNTSLPRTAYRFVAAAIVVGAVGASATVLAKDAPSREASVAESIEAPTAKRTELPREWVWTKKAHSFDSMYRR